MNPAPITISDRTPRLGNGWEWVPLGDVARLATGHTPDRSVPDYWNGGIPWISLTEIRDLDGRLADRTELNVSREGIRHSSSVVLPARTVCLSRTASIGFVTVMGTDMATSQDFVNWVCGPLLDPFYLMRALIASRQHVRSLSSGSTHKTLYMRVAERFRVLLPPIEEQRRIASILDKADELRAKRRAALAHLDSLTQSIFLDMFGDGSGTVKLGDATAHVTKGTTPSSIGLSTSSAGVPFLRAQDLLAGNVDGSKATEFISLEVHSALGRSRILAGDVLLSIAGTIGRVGIAAQGVPEMNCNQAVALIRPSEELLPRYLASWLATDAAQRQMGSSTVTATISNLSLGQIRSLRLPIPPIDLQRTFVRRSDVVERALGKVHVASRSLDSLLASLQQRAFSGAL